MRESEKKRRTSLIQLQIQPNTRDTRRGQIGLRFMEEEVSTSLNFAVMIIAFPLEAYARSYRYY